VPPYVIFHDKTLREISVERPLTVDDLRGISGVGETRAARYGEAIVQLVAEAS
jgi:ATP-dependent DNA helicase RecQ